MLILETSLEEALLLLVLLLSTVNEQYQGKAWRGLDCLTNSIFLNFFLLVSVDLLHHVVFPE